jgi:hypothetical protein
MEGKKSFPVFQWCSGTKLAMPENLPLEKVEGKELLGRTGHKREDNIKMNLHEIGLEGMGWIFLV